MKLRYRLTGTGWAEAVLEDEKRAVTISASYPRSSGVVIVGRSHVSHLRAAEDRSRSGGHRGWASSLSRRDSERVCAAVNVVWSSEARKALRSIKKFIAQDSEFYAARMVARIVGRRFRRRRDMRCTSIPSRTITRPQSRCRGLRASACAACGRRRALRSSTAARRRC